MKKRRDAVAVSLHLNRPPTTVPPPPRRPNPDHPPYAEMVQVALRSLAEAAGSTESAISRFIVSRYPCIPPGHPKLLPYYLRKLVTAGELSVPSPGRYLLPQHLISTPNSDPPPPPPPAPALALDANPPSGIRWGRSRARRPRTRIAPPPADPPVTVRDGDEPMPSRRLILRLRRKTIADDNVEGTATIGWCCMEDEGKESEKSHGRAPSEFTTASLPDKESSLRPLDHVRSEPQGEPSALVPIMPDPNNGDPSPAPPLQVEHKEESSSWAVAPPTITKGSRRKQQTKRRRLWYEH